MSEEKGYTCKCGEFHPYVSWVFAHWDVKLLHSCDKCKRENTLLRGEVVSSRMPPTFDKQAGVA